MYYLPYRKTAGEYEEFPHEIPDYEIRNRGRAAQPERSPSLGIGRFEYNPVLSSRESYYPLIGAGFNENLRLPSGVATP